MSLDELKEGDLIRFSSDGGKTYTYARCEATEKDYTGEKDLVPVKAVNERWSLNVGPRILTEKIFERADEAELEQ